MGQKYLLDGAAFTNTAYKIVRDDEELTPGSLLLVDHTHSLSKASDAAGVPPTNASLYNIAWQEAAAILGSGDATSLRAKFVNNFTGPTQAKSERTSKGGLHLLVTQASSIGTQAAINPPDAIATRLRTLTTRQLSLFCWVFITRVSPNNSQMVEAGVYNQVASTSNNYFLGQLPNSAGLGRLSLTATAWTGAPNGTVGLNGADLPMWGRLSAFGPSNNIKSFVHYRTHLIDTALSGKTHAELEAANLALFNKTFGAGGRLNGDTWALTTADLA